ncbi:hypothetical protein CPSG_08614 [Coccidioides posadasii str. Silveira]|uniref:Uncharacterized protein n=1 Tax=Coccidioides posadasii (strain RMSCC 757 / Silveira) TaxID=443226 RepID=E9DF58_COCPS|nr:hypothetical protein CPSG_08614 [Coccidioides posadasii str. Silveira]
MDWGCSGCCLGDGVPGVGAAGGAGAGAGAGGANTVEASLSLISMSLSLSLSLCVCGSELEIPSWPASFLPSFLPTVCFALGRPFAPSPHCQLFTNPVPLVRPISGRLG